MKRNVFRTISIFALIVLLAVACKDREAEKKIAELNSRLAEVESKKASEPLQGVQTTPTPETDAAQGVKPEGPLPAFQFQKIEHDFGTIKEGQVVEYTYAFKNNGEAPLIISDAKGSCGCTVSEYTKDPIPVGGTGYVKAKFDSNGKPGAQNKAVTVTANTWPTQTVLRFKAMVLAKAQGGSEGPVR